MKPDTRFTGNDLRKIDPKFKSQGYEQYLKAVEMLDSFTRKNYGKRIIHLAVRWMEFGIKPDAWLSAEKLRQFAPKKKTEIIKTFLRTMESLTQSISTSS